MKKTTFCSLFVCCFLLFLTPFSMAEEVEVKLGTDEWPPFRIIDENAPHKMRGIDIDVLDLFTEKMDIKLRILRIPWSRCLNLMKTGKLDMMTGLAYTEERAKYIHYIKIPYYEVAPAFYVYVGNRDMVRSYSDLYKYSIGYVRGSSYFEPFNSDSKMNKRPVSYEEQLVQMLVRRRIAVIVGTDRQVEYDVARLGYNHKIEKTHYIPDAKTPLYFGLSKKSPFIKQRDNVRIAVDELIRSGIIEKAASKYFQ